MMIITTKIFILLKYKASAQQSDVIPLLGFIVLIKIFFQKLGLQNADSSIMISTIRTWPVVVFLLM